MTDLRKAAQNIVNAEYAEVSATLCYVPKELLEALREALQADHIEESLVMVQPEPVAIIHHDLPNHVGWNPETDVLKFKDGEKLYTTPPSIDALIAEIDGLRRHGDDNYIYGFDIDPILDKYRSVK